MKKILHSNDLYKASGGIFDGHIFAMDIVEISDDISKFLNHLHDNSVSQALSCLNKAITESLNDNKKGIIKYLKDAKTYLSELNVSYPTYCHVTNSICKKIELLLPKLED